MRAFLFPGQGSQAVGMGADLFESDSWFRDLISLATELTGADLQRICLRGPERELARTEVLQPLLVAVCLGYCGKLFKVGVQPQLVLGHSLGEVAALACAGVLDFADAVRVAAKRGELMAAAAAQTPGGMLAVLCSERGRVLKVLAPVLRKNCLFPANDNAPGQLLLSGTTQGIADAASALRRAKVPCKELAVAGPWHTPLMDQAQQAFSGWLRHVPFHPPRVPLLMNVTGTVETQPGRLRELLVQNLTRPVQWRAAMACLLSFKPGVLFEVGPGRVLSGLARANGFSDDVRIINVSNRQGLLLAGVWLASLPEVESTAARAGI